MQGAAARKPFPVVGDGEISNVFGHFQLRPRQHDAIGGIRIDQRKNGPDVAHGGFVYVEPNGCGRDGHTASSARRVPKASPSSSR